MQTLNDKGAVAWKSTGDPFLDLFANNNLTVDSCLTAANYQTLIMTINKALSANVELFLKLMKYTRSIDDGKGAKLMYYLMISILRHHLLPANESTYLNILDWSHECNKDLLHLGHINYKFSHRKRQTVPEVKLYAKYLRQLLENILQDQTKLPSGSLLTLKYINTGHFRRLSQFIWDQVGVFDLSIYHPTTDNGKYIHQLLLKTSGSVTNKVARLIKTRYHEDLNLLDKLFQGSFPDGSKIEHHSSVESERVAELLGKCAAKCGEKTRLTIKKYQKDGVTDTLHQVLIDGFLEHQRRIKEKKLRVKVHGLDLADKCMEYFTNSDTDDVILEAQLVEIAAKLRNELTMIGGAKQVRKIGQKLNLIVDQSGSMDGKPLNAALFQALMFWEVFKVKKVYFFADSVRVLDLPEVNGMCSKIKHLYTHSTGTTNLQSVFDHLVANGDSAEVKMNLILTDGDCDPNYHVNNPFQTALVHFSKHMYCVFNLKEESLSFPYLDTDPRVCYISGHNPSVINSVIKSLAVAIKNGVQINPTMILSESLSKFDTSSLGVNLTVTDDTTINPQFYQELSVSMNRNVPKKSVPKPNVAEWKSPTCISESTDSDSDSD